MSQLDKVLYTAKTHTVGGREVASHSLDGRLDVKLSRPGAVCLLSSERPQSSVVSTAMFPRVARE